MDPEEIPLLHTERLDLKEIKREHILDLYKIFSNSKVTEYYDLETLQKKEEAEKIFLHHQEKFLNNQGIRWGISLKEEDNIIGTIGYNSYEKNHRANIAYDLRYEYWGNGYISEAILGVIKFGFNVLEVNRIEATVMPGNIESEKVLEKAKFTYEGVLREFHYWNGQYYDMEMFSLLRSDFYKEEFMDDKLLRKF